MTYQEQVQRLLAILKDDQLPAVDKSWDVYAGFTFMGTIKARNAFNAINKFKHLSPDTTNWSAKRR